MTTLHILLLIAFIFLCVLLISSVLLQSGKGGGMAGLGGGNSDSAFGAHTANVLQKFTLFCVVSFFVLVIVLAHTLQDNARNQDSVMDDFTPKVTAPVAEASVESTVGIPAKVTAPTIDIQAPVAK